MPEGLGLFAGNAFVEVLPEFSKFASEAKAEMSKAAGGIEGEAAKAFAGVGKAATFALVGAAVAIGAASIEMADKFEASHARLETALHNIGDSFEAESKHVGALDKSMERFGFTNADTESSLAKLVPATHNSATAITDMHLAADIARGRNTDLASATDLLVKVEAGRFTQLTRLGILTKEQAANIHSVADATKILGQVYGGNASAYADTFAGKMQVLRATSEDLAKNIGLRLIPILETLASDGLHVVQWLEDHHAAAVALGIVIGGPLVAAMGTYVALQAKALAENVAGFFSGIADAAGSVIGPLLGLNTALAATDAEIGASALAEAGAASTAAAGGLAALGAVALPVAAAVAVTAGAVWLYNRALDASDKSDQAWAQGQVNAAVAMGNASKTIAAERGQLQTKLEAIRQREHGYISGDQVRTRNQLDDLSAAWKKHQQAVSDAAKKAAQDHHAATAAIQGDSGALSQAATAEGKATVKAFADLSAAIGPAAAEVQQTMGLTGTQAAELAKQINSTTGAMASSFESATSVVQKFDGQASVSFKDVNKYLKDQVKATEDWSKNIQALAHSGIDGGLLQELAEAGPKAAPLVAALLADVKAGNVGAINQMETDMRTALANAQGAVTSAETDFYDAGLGLGWSVVHGFAAALANLSTIKPTAVDSSGHKYTAVAGVNVGGHAAGGFTRRQQLSWLSEGDKEELVLPLTDPRRTHELLAQAGLLSGGSASNVAALGSSTPTAAAAGPTFIAQGVVGNKAAVTRWMREAFSDHFGGSSPHNRPVWASGTADR